MNSYILDVVGKTAWGFAVAAGLVAVLFFAHGIVFAANAGIEARLEGKSAAERSNIKAAEIVSSNPEGTYQDTTYGLTVEIQSVSKIEGGVEVFARAWRGASQLGFGKDGSVEIERFRIFNPPVLIPDPYGDIVREWVDDVTEEQRQEKFREDPLAAIRQDLTHTVSLVGKEGRNIVKGKIGNTTSTFHPAAGASAPVDGDAERGAVDETFATIIAGNGTGVDTTLALRSVPYLGSFASANQFDSLNRGIWGFDTSSIPDADTIESATLSFVSDLVVTGLGDTEITIVPASPASNSSLTSSDYQSAFTRTLLGSKTVSTFVTNDSTYNDISLNSTGENHIDTADYTFFGAMLDWDFDQTFGGSWSSSTTTRTRLRMADQTGTTQDPKLVVEHTAPPILGYAVRKSVTETIASDTTTDNDSELAVELAQSKKYAVVGVIFASSTSAVPDIKVAFTVPSGAEMDIAIVPASEVAELLQTSDTDSAGIQVPANQPIAIQVTGTVKTGTTAGPLRFQWAQNTSDASATGVLRGSYLRVEEI